MVSEKDNSTKVLNELYKLKVTNANRIAKILRIHYFTAERILERLCLEKKAYCQRFQNEKFVSKYYSPIDQTRTGLIDENFKTK